MKPPANTDNRIFLHTFFGVLLFIAAVGFIVASMADMADGQLSYSFASILGVPSLTLLYKAIKNDRYRLRQLN